MIHLCSWNSDNYAQLLVLIHRKSPYVPLSNESLFLLEDYPVILSINLDLILHPYSESALWKNENSYLPYRTHVESSFLYFIRSHVAQTHVSLS